MMNLYSLTQEYKHALEVLDDSEHLPEVIKDTLDGLKDAIEVKAQNVIGYVLNLESDCEAIKAAETRLKARREVLQARAEYLKKYTLEAMQAAGIESIESDDRMFVVKVKQNPESVELDDSLPLLPAEFWRETVKREPNKIAIKAALKLGNPVPGARLTRTLKLDVK